VYLLGLGLLDLVELGLDLVGLGLALREVGLDLVGLGLALRGSNFLRALNPTLRALNPTLRALNPALRAKPRKNGLTRAEALSEPLFGLLRDFGPSGGNKFAFYDVKCEFPLGPNP